MKIWYVVMVLFFANVQAQDQFRAARPDAISSVQLVACSDAALIDILRQLVCSLKMDLNECCSFLTSQIDAITLDIEVGLASLVDIFENLTLADQVIQNIILVLSIIDNINDSVITSLIDVIQSSGSSFDQIVSQIDADIAVDQTIDSYVDIVDTQLDIPESLLDDLVGQNCQSVHEIMISDIDAISSDMDNVLLLAQSILQTEQTVASVIDKLDTQFDAIASVAELLAADACASSSDGIASSLAVLQEQEASCCANLSSHIDAIGIDIDTRLDAIQNMLDIVSDFNGDGSRLSTLVSVIELIENNDLENFVVSSFDHIASQIESLQACATIPLSQAGTINAPGNYCLTQDITGNITIATSNVSLDLQGFTVVAAAVPNDTAIYINQNLQNIEVTNGYVDATAARFGIIVDVGCQGITLSDITVKNAQELGLIADGVTGPITDLSLSGITVQDGADGYFLRECQGKCVDCIASANTGVGVTISAPYLCLILQHVQAKNNGSEGYVIQDVTPNPSSTVLAYNCLAYANGASGFSFIGSNIGIYNCISSSNAGNGFYINTTDSTGLIYGSSAIANSLGGFVLDTNTTNVKFAGNYSTDNKLLGTNIAVPVNYGYSDTNVYVENVSPFWWLYWNSTFADKWTNANGSNPT